MASLRDHRTPRCEVYWDGFKSDTYTLQSEGWEAALEHASNPSLGYGRVTLILRHRQTRMAMYCESRDPYGKFMDLAWPSGSMWEHGAPPPVFQVSQVAADSHFQVTPSRAMNFSRVDLHPLSYEIEQSVSLKNTTIFPPWQEAARDLIVAPDQVADLLERISKLQEPELVAIQQRNRDRDRRDAVMPIRHATILSLAA